MRENKEYYEKGFYNHDQIGGFVSVKQFILIEKNGKRVLLLRFSNDSPVVINRMRFQLTQLDKEGNTIDCSKVKYTDLSVAPGSVFAPEEGIVVKSECADFIVRIIYVVSGEFKYVPGRGRPTAHYDVRGYDEPKANGEDVEPANGPRTVIRRRETKRGFFRFIAAVAFIFALLSFAYSYYLSLGYTGLFR